MNDELVEPFFAAAREGRFVVQHCSWCEALRWPPLVGCPECLSRDTTWVEVEPTGTVWSWVTYHRAFRPGLADDIPYTVATVQLDSGPYVVARLVDGAPEPRIGDRVVAELFDVADTTTLPVRWRAA